MNDKVIDQRGRVRVWDRGILLAIGAFGLALGSAGCGKEFGDMAGGGRGGGTGLGGNGAAAGAGGLGGGTGTATGGVNGNGGGDGSSAGGTGTAGSPGETASGGAAGGRSGVGGGTVVPTGGSGTAGRSGSGGMGGRPGSGGMGGRMGSGGRGGAGAAGGRGGGTGGAGGSPASGGKFTVYTTWPFDETEAARRQTETAAALGIQKEIDVDLGGGVTMTMVLIPAGTVTLGCTDAPFMALPNSPSYIKNLENPAATNRCEGDESIRSYTLAKPLVIGKTVVTVGHYNALAPSFPTDQTPMSGSAALPARVTYRQAQDVLRAAINARAPAGWTFRMPDKNEWEYAARAGVTTYFTSGNNEANLAETGWYSGNSNNMLHEVGLKKPNAWNLFDMVGNSWTWIWFGTGSYGDTSTDAHAVMSCGYGNDPLDNYCRISNLNISGSEANTGPQAVRFVADIPTQ